MKKNFFLLMAAVATLAGCSNDETMDVVQPQKQAIGFKTFVDKATRADVSATTLESSGFWIWADANATGTSSSELILNGDKTTYSSSTWKSETTRYWQAKTNYAFTAIGPWDEKGALVYTHSLPSDAANFITQLHGSLTYDIEKSQAKTDLVHAFAVRELGESPTSDDYKAVSLTFNHLLSKVTVEFTNNVGAANLRIKNLTITSAKTGKLTLEGKSKDASKSDFGWTEVSGSYTTSALPLTEGNLTEIGSGGSSVKVVPATKSANNEPLYLLPGQETLTLSFDAQLYSGSEPGQSYNHTGTATITGGLKAGHSYILKTTLTPTNIVSGGLNPIEFTVTSVAVWEHGGTADVTVN